MGLRVLEQNLTFSERKLEGRLGRFDGRTSREQYEHEHPLDTLAITKASGSGREAKEESEEEHRN